MPEQNTFFSNGNDFDRKRPNINRMAAASQFLGIFSVISIGFFFLPGIISAIPLGLICCNMGILFAHLSKGNGYRFSPQAMVGLGTSIFSLVIYITLILISLMGFYMAVQMFGLETVLDPDALQKALSDFVNQYMNSLTTGGGTL